ncbi:hypothetical protein [Bacillus salipaludis]|uniref:Uncharacterized protein n=1 Tax=Bacillus salipaludis TaxID=2547811 RepID=A0ABW8RGB1_9BACI
MNLVKVEMMNATERIAEALQMRGLFVVVKDDFIMFTEGNTKADVEKTRALLTTIGIPTLWQENKFQVLINRTSISIMKQIMNATGREFPVHMEGYHFHWRSFAQRRFGIKVNALDLDANMAMLVKTLNLVGITSLAGCNGHHHYTPNVQFSGVFQGAWFEVIQKTYLSGLTLQHNWQVHYGNRTGSCLRANESSGRWDMNLIYQDTVQMAEVLQKHAGEIRELKNRVFKRNNEMKKAATHFTKEKDYSSLVNWMKKQVKGTLQKGRSEV